MTFIARIGAGLLAACALAFAGSPQLAAADPVKTPQGTVQLPISGMVIDLKRLDGREYHVSGSWFTNDTGSTFNGHDIIDEIDLATGTVVAGSWVYSGYFDAGDCDPVLAGEELDNDWKADANIWGQDWKVRGGVFTFEGVLGRRPAAMLCRSNGNGRSLLLYRFITNQPETLDQSAIMADVRASGSLAEVSRSFDAVRTAETNPVRRPEVTQRGGVQPSRPVTLNVTELTLQYPDDGYFWIANGDPDNGVDVLTRVLPSMPDTDIEIAMARGATCDDIGDILGEEDTVANHAPVNVSSEWQILPTVKLPGGEVELAICQARPEGAVLVGVMQGATNRDIGPLRMLLDALLAAKLAPSVQGQPAQ